MLVTGSCTSDIGYFRIRLNRFDVIETVTCFTKQVKRISTILNDNCFVMIMFGILEYRGSSYDRVIWKARKLAERVEDTL